VAVRIEYVGFTSTDRWREYRLRVQEGAVPTRRLTLSPEDLLHYTVAHSQKPATRRAAAGRPVPREPNAAPAFTSKPWRP
jgi:hypothetical protein